VTKWVVHVMDLHSLICDSDVESGNGNVSQGCYGE